ncbi:MAG: hypothetical protein ABIW57_03260, partial [Polyangia bacterium]
LGQFLDKLTGLGFLEGSTAGAQPSVLAPFSPSSGSPPFGDLPTTVAVDVVAAVDPIDQALSALDEKQDAKPGAPVRAAAGRSRTPTPFGAAAPQRLLDGDATEYRLKGAGSGLWERPQGLGAVTPPPATEPAAVLPQLEVLADPLPPVAAEPAVGSKPVDSSGVPHSPPPSFPMASDMPPPTGAPLPNLSIPVRWPPPDLSALGGSSSLRPPRAPTRAEATPSPSGAAVPTGADTPLASIAHAIAESFASAPAGALDAGTGSGRAGAGLSPNGDVAGGTPGQGTSQEQTRPGFSPHPGTGEPGALTGAGSWAANLADEIEDRPPLPLVHAPPGARRAGSGEFRAAAHEAAAAASADSADSVDSADSADSDRRQPPPPEVVVMPPMADPVPSAAPQGRRSVALPLLLVVLAAAGSAAYWTLRTQPSDQGGPPPVSSAEAVPQVHVVSPQPTTFYRWFEPPGVLTPGQDDTLSFRTVGRVQEVMPPGTTFAAGETIARLRGVAERELAVNRLRSRIAYYEQLRDSSTSRDSGKGPDKASDAARGTVQQVELKLVARRQELAAAQAALAEWEIRPSVPGTIAELFVAPGALVKAGMPIVHIRSTGPRATFPLSVDDAAKSRALKFCRVETIPGTGSGTGAGGAGTGAAAAPESGARAVDCTISAGAVGSGAADSPLGVGVDLIGASAVAPGTQFRLASARYDGVFPLPRAGLVREGGVDHVWVVSGGGRFAERRTVEVVDTVDDLALIAHGVAVGDGVVVDP